MWYKKIPWKGCNLWLPPVKPYLHHWWTKNPGTDEMVETKRQFMSYYVYQLITSKHSKFSRLFRGYLAESLNLETLLERWFGCWHHNLSKLPAGWNWTGFSKHPTTRKGYVHPKTEIESEHDVQKRISPSQKFTSLFHVGFRKVYWHIYFLPNAQEFPLG